MVASVDLITATGNAAGSPTERTAARKRSLSAPRDDVPANDDEMSFLTTQSVACLVTGGTATLAALGFGWQNVTNLISGGVVPAAGPGAVALGLFGVVFTSFCAIGQALTPLYLDIVNGGLPPAPARKLPPRSAAAGADFTADAHPCSAVHATPGRPCRPADAVEHQRSGARGGPLLIGGNLG